MHPQSDRCTNSVSLLPEIDIRMRHRGVWGSMQGTSFVYKAVNVG